MSGPAGPAPEESSSEAHDPAEEEDERPETRGELAQWLDWIRRVDRGPIAVAREFAISVLIVLVIAMILFAISGVWPPLVAVESDSMEPQIMTGDLVFIVETDRFGHDSAVADTGVVPNEVGSADGHSSFGMAGDVIIFMPNGDANRTPIIHRAHLWVWEGEDWVERADPALLGGAESCFQIPNCPAPHEGFITHGDNNEFYDQIQDRSEPVKPEWVIARAHFRIPWVGHIRLIVAEWFGVVAPVPAAWA